MSRTWKKAWGDCKVPGTGNSSSCSGAASVPYYFCPGGDDSQCTNSKPVTTEEEPCPPDITSCAAPSYPLVMTPGNGLIMPTEAGWVPVGGTENLAFQAMITYNGFLLGSVLQWSSTTGVYSQTKTNEWSLLDGSLGTLISQFAVFGASETSPGLLLGLNSQASPINQQAVLQFMDPTTWAWLPFADLNDMDLFQHTVLGVATFADRIYVLSERRNFGGQVVTCLSRNLAGTWQTLHEFPFGETYSHMVITPIGMICVFNESPGIFGPFGIRVAFFADETDWTLVTATANREYRSVATVPGSNVLWAFDTLLGLVFLEATVASSVTPLVGTAALNLSHVYAGA